MVELRKRPPPKEPAAAAPPSKKGRASASTSKTKAAAATAKSEATITSRVKATASKAKEAITTDKDDTPTQTTTPKDSEPSVETGEAGLVPATTGTAPSTTTIPEPTASDDSAKVDAQDVATSKDAPQSSEQGKSDKAAPSTTADNIDEATLPLSATSIGQLIPKPALQNLTVSTHTGGTLSLSDLFFPGSGSNNGTGSIIFTYPRASTPGCTQQVCLFRDNHDAFTAVGGTSSAYKVYGLSADSVKANANFATKQNIQYELLCDPEASLTGILGLKKPGNAKGTLRGVVVVDGTGKVRVWMQGGPAKTVDAVKEFLASEN